MRKTRKAQVAVGVFVAVALAVSACSSSASKSTATSSAPSSAAAGSSSSSAPAALSGEIKIGAIVEQFPKDNTIPFFFRTDAQAAEQAIVDGMNADGGISGKKVVVDFQSVPIDGTPTGIQAACLNMKKDGDFAVLNGYTTTAYGGACFMTQGHMPVIDQTESSLAADAAYNGYHMTNIPSLDASAKDWVYGAQSAGLFDKSKGFKKVGLVSLACEADIWDNPTTGIKHWLNVIGVPNSDISDFRSSCDTESILKNHQAALLKHRQDGVTTVMIAAQPLDRNYTALAEKSGFNPKYVWGDFHFATEAANAQSLNQKAIEGSTAVTSIAQNVTNPASAKCNSYVSKAGLPAFKAIQTDLLVMNFCSDLNIFKAVAEKAGPDMTAESFVAAGPKTGKIPSAVELSIDFTNTVHGGETIQIDTWSGACTCWKPTGDPRPSYYTYS